MKFFVAIALLGLVAVSLAQPVAEQETLSAVPNAEEKESVAPAAAAPEGKDLDTANSLVYGYPYGGYYGGYGYSPVGYGGYGYGLGYGAYPYYGGYGGYLYY